MQSKYFKFIMDLEEQKGWIQIALYNSYFVYSIISSIIHYYNSSHKNYIMNAIRSTSINECLNAMRESRDLQGLLVPVRASVQEFEG